MRTHYRPPEMTHAEQWLRNECRKVLPGAAWVASTDKEGVVSVTAPTPIFRVWTTDAETFTVQQPRGNKEQVSAEALLKRLSDARYELSRIQHERL